MYKSDDIQEIIEMALKKDVYVFLASNTTMDVTIEATYYHIPIVEVKKDDKVLFQSNDLSSKQIKKATDIFIAHCKVPN